MIHTVNLFILYKIVYILDLHLIVIIVFPTIPSGISKDISPSVTLGLFLIRCMTTSFSTFWFQSCWLHDVILSGGGRQPQTWKAIWGTHKNGHLT